VNNDEYFLPLAEYLSNFDSLLEVSADESIGVIMLVNHYIHVVVTNDILAKSKLKH